MDNTAGIDRFEILSEEGISAGTRRITALTGPRATHYSQKIEQTIKSTAQSLSCVPDDIPAALAGLQREQRELKKMLASGVAPADAGTTISQDPSANGTPGSNPSGANEVTGVAHGKTATLPPMHGKQVLSEAARLLSVAIFDVPKRIATLQEEVGHLHERLAQRSASGPLTADHLLELSETVAGVTVIIAEAPTAESNLMRQLIDQIRQKISPSAVLLASTEGAAKVTLVAGISRDLQARGGHAGNWIRPVAQVLGGGGGGRPDMAQAGGKRPDKLPEALEVARQTIAQIIEG